jgi:hypothetical protein
MSLAEARSGLYRACPCREREPALSFSQPIAHPARLWRLARPLRRNSAEAPWAARRAHDDGDDDGELQREDDCFKRCRNLDLRPCRWRRGLPGHVGGGETGMADRDDVRGAGWLSWERAAQAEAALGFVCLHTNSPGLQQHHLLSSPHLRLLALLDPLARLSLSLLWPASLPPSPFLIDRLSVIFRTLRFLAAPVVIAQSLLRQHRRSGQETDPNMAVDSSRRMATWGGVPLKHISLITVGTLTRLKAPSKD